MILNSNHYSGLFFSTEFTGGARAPRPHVLRLTPIDPCAQENMHVPIVVTLPNFSGHRYMSTNRLVVILSEGM